MPLLHLQNQDTHVFIHILNAYVPFVDVPHISSHNPEEQAMTFTASIARQREHFAAFFVV